MRTTTIVTAALLAACTSRPSPVPAETAGAVALLDLPFADIEVPSDSRGGVFPEAEIPLGPWTVLSGSGGMQRWETRLPVRVRSLFYFAPPQGMKVLDDTGGRVRHYGATEPDEPAWGYDGQSLRLETPLSAPPIPSRAWTLSWPVAQAREAALNFAFSGAPDAGAFARATIQDGGTARTGVLLPAPGRAAWDLTVPPAAELIFAPGVVLPEVADGPPSDGVGFSWEIVEGADTTVVWSDRMDAGDAFPSVRVDLSGWAGKAVRLVLRTDPLGDPRFDYAFVGDPRVASRQEAPRQVVILFVDTLRPDHMGLYGYGRPTTPHVDAWARDAVVFDSARSIAPWTLPTARTLVTGRHPEHYDTTDTLPDRLRREGFATAMIAGNVYLSANFDMQRGWGLHRVRHKPPASEQVDLALQWLAENEGSDTLLMLHFMDVHLPYLEPAAWRRVYAGDAPPALGERFHRGNVLRGPIGPTEEAYVKDRYDNCIGYVDEQIGRLLDGLGDDAVVVFLSDHGEEFWEHGDFEHGHTLYDEVLRVPLIVKAPGLAPARVAEPVSLLDVTPTILDLLDVEPDAPMDGWSLVPAARADVGAREALWGRDQAFGRVLYGETRWGALRGSGKYMTTAGLETAYDLEKDPIERIDRLRGAPDSAAEFRGRLADALGTEVRIGFRLLPNDVGLPPDNDLVVRMTVPGGVATAFVGDDPTGSTGAEVRVEGDVVVATWPKRYRLMREVFVVPVLPYEEAAAGLEVSGHFGELVGKGRIDVVEPYRTDDATLLAVQLGGRTVRLNRAVVPMPFEAGQALEGYDAELSTMLQAMGYAVGDDGGEGGTE